MSAVATRSTNRKSSTTKRPKLAAVQTAPVQAVIDPPDPTLAAKTDAQLLRYVLGFELGQAEPVRDAAADAWTLHDGAEAMDPRQLQRVTFALARRLEVIAIVTERDDDEYLAARNATEAELRKALEEAGAQS